MKRTLTGKQTEGSVPFLIFPATPSPQEIKNSMLCDEIQTKYAQTQGSILVPPSKYPCHNKPQK